MQVKIAAAIEVNQATIARFEDGTAWPRRPEEVLTAYATELDMDVPDLRGGVQDVEERRS